MGGFGDDSIALLESGSSRLARRMLGGGGGDAEYHINITSGNGDDEIHVFTTGKGTEMIVDAGNGDDKIELFGLGGNATVYGGNGTNRFFGDARYPGDEERNTM